MDQELYRKAEAEANTRSGSLSEDELLDRLRQCLRKQGRVSERLLKVDPEMLAVKSMSCGLEEWLRHTGESVTSRTGISRGLSGIDHWLRSVESSSLVPLRHSGTGASERQEFAAIA